MITNAWYVLGFTEELRDQLHGAVVCGRPVVAWRSRADQVVAFDVEQDDSGYSEVHVKADVGVKHVRRALDMLEDQERPIDPHTLTSS